MKASHLYTAFFCWSLLFTQPLMSQVDLASYRWNNRLILLFFPSSEDEGLQAIREEINSDRAEIEDRELVVFQLVEKGESRIEDRVVPATSAQALRERYRVRENEATLVLIGKDGGEKRRQVGSKINLKSLYPLIDGMPMRRQEMRRKGNG